MASPTDLTQSRCSANAGWHRRSTCLSRLPHCNNGLIGRIWFVAATVGGQEDAPLRAKVENKFQDFFFLENHSPSGSG